MRFLIPLVSVALATLLARVLGVDALVTAMLLLMAVVVAALFGTMSGVVAAGLGGAQPEPGVLRAISPAGR